MYFYTEKPIYLHSHKQTDPIFTRNHLTHKYSTLFFQENGRSVPDLTASPGRAPPPARLKDQPPMVIQSDFRKVTIIVISHHQPHRLPPYGKTAPASTAHKKLSGISVTRDYSEMKFRLHNVRKKRAKIESDKQSSFMRSRFVYRRIVVCALCNKRGAKFRQWRGGGFWNGDVFFIKKASFVCGCRIVELVKSSLKLVGNVNVVWY